MLELIARRQLRAWTDWRPWVALVGLVAPLGMVLSIVSRSWATGSGIYAWFYLNNWTWAYLDSPGARRDLAHAIEGVCSQFLALIVWSWTIGFALGSVSRRAMWVNGAVFCVVLFGGTLGSTTAGLLNPGNAAVFSLALYRVALPAIVRTVLIVLPAVSGMQRASRPTMLRLPQAIGWALVAITLAALNAPRLQVSVLFGWLFQSAAGPVVGVVGRDSWPLRVAPWLMVWPAAYVLVTAAWRSRQHEPPDVNHGPVFKEGNA